MTWKTKFDEHVASLESNKGKLKREMDDIDEEISRLRNSITDYIRESSKLQTEAEVIAMKLFIFWKLQFSNLGGVFN